MYLSLNHNSKFFNFLIYSIIITQVVNNSILPMILPIPSFILTVVLYLSFIFLLLLYTKKFTIEITLFIFILIAVISLILNDVEDKFNAPFRLLSWILLLIAVGPLLYNYHIINLRIKLLNTFFQVFMFIGIISFFYWITGIPQIGRGHFTGIMNHSMTLAPISALGAFFAFQKFKQSEINKEKYIYLTFFIMCTVCLLLASSRIAFLGFSIGFLSFIIFSKFHYKRIIITILISVSTFNFLNFNNNINYTNMNSSITEGLINRGLDNTREGLWKDRILEFENNPYFGVGFASQDDTIEGKSGKKASSFGKIEPGSTYLMILSMTGLIGALTLIVFLLKIFLSKAFWKYIINENTYLFATFVFFSIHFIAEGYIFSSGSLLACVFWTLIGATYPYSGISYNSENNL